MKKGSKVEVRNIGSDEAKAESWAGATVLRANADGTVLVRVNHEGHELHGLELTCDSEHVREK